MSDILTEDSLVYNKEDFYDMLNMINEGNKTSGGLVKLATACGIVGFVKFLDCYYLTLVTSKRKVGCIAGNMIYSIKSTEVFPIRPREATDSNTLAKIWRKLNQKLSQSSTEIAESRYMGLFQFVDVTKDFFFSYDYDLTNSLQHNYLLRNNFNKKIDLISNKKEMLDLLNKPNDMFVWNQYQTDGNFL